VSLCSHTRAFIHEDDVMKPTKLLARARIASAHTDPIALASAASIELDERKLERYLEAQREALIISEEYRERIEEAVDREEEALDLYLQFKEEVERAVRGRGLSIEQYEEIAVAARSDPDLRARVAEIKQHERAHSKVRWRGRSPYLPQGARGSPMPLG
jgi:hypothetical protein